MSEIIGRSFNYEIKKLPAPGLVSPVRIAGALPPGYSHKQPGHKAALAWIRGDQPIVGDQEHYASARTGYPGESHRCF